MDEIKTSQEIDHRRRHFVGTAALTVAAAQLGMVGAASAQPGKAKLPSVSRNRTRRSVR
jgi:nitrous oxide reductase